MGVKAQVTLFSELGGLPRGHAPARMVWRFRHMCPEQDPWSVAPQQPSNS